MDVSLHRYPFVILIPLFFCLNFYFFLWIQTGFEAKAAFDPSRLVNLSTNLPASTSNFTITLKKYTQIYRYNCPSTQILLLQGFKDVLSPKRDDGKRISSTSENLKNGSPDQKSRCHTCAQGCYSPFKDDMIINLCCNLSETDSSIVNTNGNISLFGHWYYS